MLFLSYFLQRKSSIGCSHFIRNCTTRAEEMGVETGFFYRVIYGTVIEFCFNLDFILAPKDILVQWRGGIAILSHFLVSANFSSMFFLSIQPYIH